MGHIHSQQQNSATVGGSSARAKSRAGRLVDERDSSNHAAVDCAPDIVSLLCATCWKTVFNFHSFQKVWFSKDSGRYRYTAIWTEVLKSADAGCNWCKLVVATIRKDYPVPRKTYKVTIHLTQVAPGYPVLDVTVGELRGQNRALAVCAAPSDVTAQHVACRELVWQISSPTSFKLASEWLEACTNGHDSCAKLLSSHSMLLSSHSTLPTRVLDCSDPEKPKLHISSGSHGTYAALSYVWGGRQDHSTRMSNIDAYIQGIKLETLPQTIVDAIIATSRLGIRYLWVDSICILQDSEEDKIYELTQICRIYRDAYVTIIAASADNANAGFLQDRPTPPTVPLPFRCPDGKIGTMSLRPPIKKALEPVDTRAWCFQEGLLSPRALIFASHTLQYRCRTSSIHTATESSFMSEWKLEVLRLPIELLQSNLPMSLSAKELHDVWNNIVSEYSDRETTRPSDKLVALAGIAELFGRVWSSSKYLAGLWQNSLLQDLLWWCASPSLRRPATYRAPSWSWAAVDGHINPGLRDGEVTYKPICEVLQCEVRLASETLPFAEVTSGSVQLHAVLKRVLWDLGTEGIYAFETDVSDNEGNSVSSPKARLGPTHRDCIGDVPPSTSNQLWSVWAVPLLSHDAWVQGLILIPDSGKDEQFRRIGVFKIRSTRWPLEDGTDLAAWLGTPRREVTIV